jgi:predicted secreted protein
MSKPRGKRAGITAAVPALCLLMCAAAPVPGAGSERREFAEPLPDRVEISIDGLVEFNLGAQLGAGYSWFVDIPARSPVRLLSSQIVPDSNSKFPDGRRERQVFTITAERKGTCEIYFDYKRPWDHGEPKKRIAVTIVAK